MKRRLLSWMLVIVMVCAMLPVNALASMAQTVTMEPVTEVITHINPLYADVLTEEDLVKPSDESAADTNEVSESEYATTFAEAGAQIRAGMTQRAETVVAYYQTENYDSGNHKDIFNAAVAHTGMPKEGDALRWVYGGYSVSISRYSMDGVYYVTYTYTMTYYTTAQQEAELDAAVENLLAQLAPSGTDYEKLCTVYDYMCENIVYDDANLNDQTYKLKYTAYAALINKTSVCQGYAALLYRLALEMGIDCRMITGTGNGGGHAWNIVKLNDVYYNADATWDASWLQGVGYYSYYLQCEDTFTEGGTDHFRDAEYDTAEFHAAYPISETDFDPAVDNVVEATSGTCGEDVTWDLTDGLLTIRGSGNMADFAGAEEQPWYRQRDNITAVQVESGVTRVGDRAFYGLRNMADATLEDSVTSIGDMAFAESGLTFVFLHDTVEQLGIEVFRDTPLNDIWYGVYLREIPAGTFSGCDQLAAIELPDGLLDIHSAAFEGCTALAQIRIPAYVRSIGAGAFSSCTALEKITFQGAAPDIAADAFSGVAAEAYYPATESGWTEDVLANYGGNLIWTAYMPVILSGSANGVSWVVTGDGTLTMSGEGAYHNLADALEGFKEIVEAVVVEPGITGEIGGFVEYPNLVSVSIPNTITEISNNAFSGCYSLAEINIPDSVVRIGSNAFYGCTSLTQIHIPASVTEYWARPFGGCTSLTGIWVDSENPCYTSDSRGVVYTKDMTTLVEAPGALEGDYVIPASVTAINWAAFDGCAKMTSVALPEGMTAIQAETFLNCHALREIVIPDGVNVIEMRAFANCSSLEKITFLGDAPKQDEFYSDAFENVTATVYYPAGNSTWTEEIMADYGGTLTWVPYGQSGPTITSQPTDYVGMVGDTATFTIAAEGEDLTYQWYFSADNGESWEKSSCTADTLTIEFRAYRVNYLYYCVVTDGAGNSVTSDAVKLTAQEVELVIVTQPVSYAGAVNDNVSFTVEATGNGLVYEWFFSGDGGETWAKSYSPGYQTNTLAPVLRSHRDGNMYKCVVSDVFGNSVESDAVSMAVKASDVVITAQPQTVKNAVLGQLYQFTVEATGDNLTYRWQVSSDGGETWEESWNQGYNSATLNVRMNANRDGNQYRCVVTSGLKIVLISDAATLDLQDPSAEIISQSGNVAVTAGKTAAFSVEADGMDLTYLWYRSNDKGATWAQTFLPGYNTDTLSFVATTNRTAMYMCKVTDGSGRAIWSSPVKLQILSAELQILTQPASVTCAAGETATFTVEAQGDTLKYQWYASSDNGATWTASYMTGYNTKEFSFVVNTARAAKLYKCIITDVAGNIVETDAVSVTIE